MPTEPNKVSARIASLVPGRMRLKLPRAHRDAAAMGHIKTHLESREGVHGVTVNATNGSLTVRYDEKRHGTAGILGWLEDLDVVVESIGHLPAVDSPEQNSPEGFLAAMDDLNRRIRSITGLPINIKLALPLAFASAGVWSILRRGLMIEAVPGWLFIWFAFDTFIKLHPNHSHRPPPPT